MQHAKSFPGPPPLPNINNLAICNCQAGYYWKVVVNEIYVQPSIYNVHVMLIWLFGLHKQMVDLLLELFLTKWCFSLCTETKCKFWGGVLLHVPAGFAIGIKLNYMSIIVHSWENAPTPCPHALTKLQCRANYNRKLKLGSTVMESKVCSRKLYCISWLHSTGMVMSYTYTIITKHSIGQEHARNTNWFVLWLVLWFVLLQFLNYLIKTWLSFSF